MSTTVLKAPPKPRAAAAVRGPLHVLDITKFYHGGGGGVRTYIDAKIDDFAERGVRHTLVVPGAETRIERRRSTRIYWLRGPRIPFAQGYRFLLAAEAVARVLEVERPDVIEVGSPLLVPKVLEWAQPGQRIPTVGFYHADLVRTYLEPYTASWPKGFRRLAEKPVRSFARRVYSRFGATVAASPSVVAELSNLGIPRVRAVSLGVDLDLFNPAKRDRRALDEFAVPKDRPVMVYAGRLCPEKGTAVLLSALERIPDEERPHLLLVGGGPSERALRARGEEIGGVSFVAFERDRARLARLLASCDLYAASGPGETFGLAVAEALASGLPVVGVDSGAVPDRVRGSGAARLYPPGDAEGCAAAILEMARLLGAGLRAAARSHAERTLSWQGTFDALVDVYHEVAGSRVS
jgi:alpha-1,6-mannosyltransferase